MVRDGIPITTPTRTLMDLASSLDHRELEQTVAEAFARRMTDRARLLAALEAHDRWPGAPILRAMLDAGPARTRSPAEERLLRLIRGAGLPEPEVNARVGRWEVDFLWRDQRLAVEVDGYATHSSPWAFERDRRKTAELQAIGLDVRRISAATVRDRPQATIRFLASAL
jgi:very-short-patch-repair endonuclease